MVLLHTSLICHTVNVTYIHYWKYVLYKPVHTLVFSIWRVVRY